MRKNVFGRQLGRTKNQRKALFRGLVASLIENGVLETTLAKAKSIKPEAERLISRAKSGTPSDRREILKFLTKRALVNRLCDLIAPVFKDRKGGYLRILRLRRRTGDQAEMVKVLFTEEIPVEVEKKEKEIVDAGTIGEKVIKKSPKAKNVKEMKRK